MTLAIKITWAIFVLVWIIGAFTSKRTVRRQSWLSRLAMLAAVFLCCLPFSRAVNYLAFAERRFLPESPIYLWIGLMLTMAGVIFAIWARIALGTNWSGFVTVKQNHELIRSGPYALVRHPIYAGITVAVLGTAIFDGEMRGIVLIIATIPALLYKINLEEQFMTEQFGSEYVDYRETTKTLVPFLW